MIIATCEERTSTVLAPMRSAMIRSGAAPIAISWVATMYHDGIVRQAGSFGRRLAERGDRGRALRGRHHGGGAAVDVGREHPAELAGLDVALLAAGHRDVAEPERRAEHPAGRQR